MIQMGCSVSSCKRRVNSYKEKEWNFVGRNNQMKTITELELEVQELREELRKTNAIISEILGLSIIPKVKYTDEIHLSN